MLARSLLAACVVALAQASALAGPPDQLLRGEAPVLFSGAEGEDADTTLLLDGQPIRGDEIWLWVPALTAGEVDLVATGEFYKVWDSGPEMGPDGNDDDDNGIRGLDFDPSSGTFLVSYEDSTTTGFAFGDILDGDLMELTPTAVNNGSITSFQWTRLFNECTSGMPGCIGEGDLNALHRAADGTLYFGSGSTQLIQIDGGGTLSVGSSTLIRASANPDPANVGPNAFFEPTVMNCPIIFCPGIYTGQLRGFDLLEDGEITFGTSGDYRNQTPSGNDVMVVGLKSDIMALPDFFDGATTLEQRTAEVLYSGALFYQTPNVGDSEILGHDILDTADEINALITVLGPGSDAGVALAPFAGGSGAEFVRGDCNNDGMVNIADAIFLLSVLFPTGVPAVPDCDDACDSNDDGTSNIADAVAALAALFGSPPVPLPGPSSCGVDVDDSDPLTCSGYQHCP